MEKIIIPTGEAGSAITAIDLMPSVGKNATGLAFAIENGPEWLTVSKDGKLTGTRPATEFAVVNATLIITEKKGSITRIPVEIGSVVLKPIPGWEPRDKDKEMPKSPPVGGPDPAPLKDLKK